MAWFDKVLSYKITAEAISPLHIGCGDSDGVVLSDGDKPYIQANSISGSFGSFYEQKWGKKEKEKLFGGNDKSKIVFSDAEIDGSFGLELRPHVKIDCKTGTAEDGGKFEIQLLGSGVKIMFNIMIFEKNNEDFSENAEHLISDFSSGNIILGGQKTNGCGCFKVTEVLKAECNMYDEKERKEYLDDNFTYKEILISKKESDFYVIELKADIADSLIVKSGGCITQYKGRFVDCETIKNANNQYIIPASSVKGVIKNHIKTIADYINADIFLKEYNENEIKD